VTTYIGFVRAINLAGKNMVAMAALRDMLTRMGFENPRSLLQSGNILFGSKPKSPEQLERLLEAELLKRLAVDTQFMVRTTGELDDAIGSNPFPKEAKSDPGHLLVLFLKDAPAAARVKALQEGIKGREVVRASGRHAYAWYPDGVGRSKLTAAMIEKHLGTRGTGRNWNTVLKLQALAAE
jgi:uncharacterized protein (DUF1697 family)